MNTKILFGNNVGYKINNFLTKKKIIDYLFKNVNENKLKNNLITSENDLINIKNLNYNILPNIVGENYIFIAIKIKEIFYSVLINKNSLDDNINYNKLDIISIKIRLKHEVYKGSILDGRIVNLGGCNVFIINRVFKLNGNLLEQYTLNESFNFLKDFINKSFIIDTNMTAILFKLNKIYKINEINILKNKLSTSKFNFSSIDFIHPNNKNIYTYYFSKQDITNNEVIIYGKLINVDVIELFTNSKNINKIKRIGIAHIPDIKTSRLCNQHISNNKLNILKCKLDFRFKKWIPLEINPIDVELTDYEIVINKMKDMTNS